MELPLPPGLGGAQADAGTGDTGRDQEHLEVIPCPYYLILFDFFSPDLLVVRIDVGGAAVTVPGTVEVRESLLEPPGAVPGHGAECDQAVASGDEHTRTRRYGAGVAAICDMKCKVFIFHFMV